MDRVRTDLSAVSERVMTLIGLSVCLSVPHCVRVYVNSFKKALDRGGTTFMQKVGQIEKSDDSAFKPEEQRFKT